MSLKQDRQGARTPAELERKYKFKKNFNEVKKTAEEAKKVAASVIKDENGLALKVEALEEDVKAKLEMTVRTDAEGNLKSKVHIGAGMMTVDTDNFKLGEDGSVEVTGSVRARTENSSVTLDEGRVKIDSPTQVKSQHNYVPLVEFTFNGAAKVLVADYYNGEQWLVSVLDGTFLDFMETEEL